jgi:hypothetical protein
MLTWNLDSALCYCGCAGQYCNCVNIPSPKTGMYCMYTSTYVHKCCGIAFFHYSCTCYSLYENHVCACFHFCTGRQSSIRYRDIALYIQYVRVYAFTHIFVQFNPLFVIALYCTTSVGQGWSTDIYVDIYSLRYLNTGEARNKMTGAMVLCVHRPGKGLISFCKIRGVNKPTRQGFVIRTERRPHEVPRSWRIWQWLVFILYVEYSSLIPQIVQCTRLRYWDKWWARWSYTGLGKMGLEKMVR